MTVTNDRTATSKARVIMLVGAQVLFFLIGASLTALWIGWGILPSNWWGTLPVVAILLLSLIVFSHQESRIGIAAQRRKRRGDPESLGGPLELVGFLTWLFMIVNMITAVFRLIRTIRGAA